MVKRERTFTFGKLELCVTETRTADWYMDRVASFWFNGKDYQVSANCRKYLFAKLRKLAGIPLTNRRRMCQCGPPSSYSCMSR